jgi:hypothetical protein
VNVACFGGGAKQRGVSAAKATTLGKPLGVGYTAPPAGEGVPYDNFVVRLADEDTEAVEDNETMHRPSWGRLLSYIYRRIYRYNPEIHGDLYLYNIYLNTPPQSKGRHRHIDWSETQEKSWTAIPSS